MEEKNIIEKTDEIIQAFTRLILGEYPGMLSNRIFKDLPKHSHFNELKLLYISHIQQFNGSYETTDDLKRLTDFRYELIKIYEKD